MTKIIWGQPGTRLFEEGVDRGVLFVAGEDGVPWNGLTAVKENPSGGDPEPYYIDGVKYLNLSSSSEFQAVIEAFGSPDEFARCDGQYAIHSGLFITQQPRLPFDFTYRSRLGNDLQGLDYGYKLHFVWNALAGSSERSNETITASPNPETLSWPISTLPPKITGYKPSSHMVVDSTKTSPELLSELEDILYGTNDTFPEMPTQAELIELFS